MQHSALCLHFEFLIGKTFSVLKHVLRTTHRMMQSSGTSEGLRTLVDSTLIRSVKKIIENRGLFGPAIFSIGKKG